MVKIYLEGNHCAQSEGEGGGIIFRLGEAKFKVNDWDFKNKECNKLSTYNRKIYYWSQIIDEILWFQLFFVIINHKNCNLFGKGESGSGKAVLLNSA